MDGIEVHGEDRQAAEPSERTRRLWTAQEKRRIVRESRRPGAVRQAVAQRHGVHVSVLNRWRTEQLSKETVVKKTVSRVRLLPVQVRRSQPSRAASRPVRATIAVPAIDVIEVALPAGQRVTVRGVVNGDLLRAVLQELSRC
jgi:transposase